MSTPEEATRAVVANDLLELWELSRRDGTFRVLFCLRKEFVDDLLLLSEKCPDLRLQDWHLRLNNFSLKVASKIITELMEQDEIGVSPELAKRVAVDLAHDGYVRPVEFQIVLTRMLENGIREISAYEARGGANGLLSKFISETLDPPDRRTSELNRQVGRHLLRALCTNNFTARRPIGLTRDELASRIFGQLAAAKGGPAFNETDVGNALNELITNFRKARVIVDEDEAHLNLAHDYLAMAVRDATADIETVEERANNLIDQYIAQSRADQHIILPFVTLRYLRRYASPERMRATETQRLLWRSYHWYFVVVTAMSVIGVIGIGVALPFGWQDRQEWRPIHGIFDGLSRNRALLAALDQNRLVLHDFKGGVDHIIMGPSDVFSYRLSPNGDRALVLRKNGNIEEISVSGGAVTQEVYQHSVWPDIIKEENSDFSYTLDHVWGGFSRDGTWCYVAGTRGDILAWPAHQRPRLFAKLKSAQAPSMTLMSRHGKYLAFADGNTVRVIRTDGGANDERDFVVGDDVNPPYKCDFSSNERRFAVWVGGAEGVVESELAAHSVATSPFDISPTVWGPYGDGPESLR